MYSNPLFLTLLAASSGLVSAGGSQITNECPGASGCNQHEPSADRCQSQGAGDWTFTMRTTLSPVLGRRGRTHSPEGGSPFVDYNSGTQFFIYDNACNVKGVYEPNTQTGKPWTIKEDWLKGDLTITNIFMDVGDPYYKFSYNGGSFETGKNHCVCHDDKSSKGLSAGKVCPCAFPVGK